MRAIVLACALLLVAPTQGALAEDITFRSPTGNINCLYLDDPRSPKVYCDITHFTPSFKTVPPGTSNEMIVCTPALLRGFTITPEATRGEAFCPTDGVNDPGSRVLPYGESISRGGITCKSETSGMSCFNAAGHGFSLSRAQQKVF